MDENLNLISLVIDELNKNDMWFTTKNDPTIQEPKDYYKLDEFGYPTDATVKKIEKEINSLIGDGAVDIDDALDLWFNDAIVDCKIDYRDNLVTVFKDKQVVDNIEAYENPVQFPKSNKVEGKKLQEHTETMLKSVDADSHWVKPFVDLFKSKYSDKPIDKIYIEVVEGGWQPCTAFIVSGYDTYRVYVASLNDGIYMSDKDDIRTVRGDFKRDYDYVEESKKCENKVKKTEGAGAGYEISGSISNAHVNSFNVDNVERTKYNERVVTITCDIDVDLDDLYFASYYYGSKTEFPVKAKITSLRMTDNDSYEDEDDEPEVDDYNIRDALNGTTFRTILGGGWIHQTFDGEFESDAEGNTYSSYFYTDFISVKIPNDMVVKFIDEKVSGTVDESTYEVFDMNSYILDSFDDEDAAIEFAKNNNGVQVVRVMHNFSLIDEEGSVDDDPDYETVWERDYDKQYKFDDVEENKKIEAYGKHDYVSKYDELNDLLDVYAGLDNGKKELYNAFNNDEMVEFDDEKYDMWLEDMKDEHFNELFDFLQEKDDETTYYKGKINENTIDRYEYVSKYTEDKLYLDGNMASKLERATDIDFSKADMDILKIMYKRLDDLVTNIYDNKNADNIDNIDTTIKNILSKADVLVNKLPIITTLNEAFNLVQVVRSIVGSKLEETFGYDFYYESKKIERKKKQIEFFKNRKVNFKLRTKDKVDENYQKRLDEVNNKSKGLIDDMVSKDDFDETSAYGRIVMRTAHMFDVLSENGYDVDVTFDNGESTSAIQLGPQGGKIMITITDAEKPLRAFTSGNFEVNDDILETLNDVQNILDTL